MKVLQPMNVNVTFTSARSKATRVGADSCASWSELGSGASVFHKCSHLTVTFAATCGYSKFAVCLRIIPDSELD